MAGCFYCEAHNEGREKLMITVGDLKYTTLYLWRDQAHKGRAVLALKEHKIELHDLTDTEREQLMEEAAQVGKAIKELWGCNKINYGAYGDKMPHLHFHICPKYEGDFEFGGTFLMNNPDPVYLSDAEYQEMIDQLKARLGI